MCSRNQVRRDDRLRKINHHERQARRVITRELCKNKQLSEWLKDVQKTHSGRTLDTRIYAIRTVEEHKFSVRNYTDDPLYRLLYF
jgi:hypothetical protein